jgi:hypothetical protein
MFHLKKLLHLTVFACFCIQQTLLLLTATVIMKNVICNLWTMPYKFMLTFTKTEIKYLKTNLRKSNISDVNKCYVEYKINLH